MGFKEGDRVYWIPRQGRSGFHGLEDAKAPWLMEVVKRIVQADRVAYYCKCLEPKFQKKLKPKTYLVRESNLSVTKEGDKTNGDNR